MDVVEDCEVKEIIVDAGGHCPDDRDNYVILLKDLREKLGEDAIISIASSANFPKTGVDYDIMEISKYIDTWNLMTYDYAGGWQPNADVHSKLYGEGPCISAAVEGFLKHGAKSG